MFGWTRRSVLGLGASLLMGCERIGELLDMRGSGAQLVDRVSAETGTHGDWFRFIPSGAARALLVVAHGTPEDDDPSAESAAHTHIIRWLELAEEHRWVVVAPRFDQERWGRLHGPWGGYRGGFGRDVDVDVFIEEIRATIAPVGVPTDSPLLLYGHSAGGQMVGRYCVRHGSRVQAAVISAAGTYAYPNPAETWTNGAAPLRTTLRWPEREREVHVEPSMDWWVAASQRRVAVVVGSLDNEPLHEIPGHRSNNRLARAQDWVTDMQSVAAARGNAAGVELRVVPGVAHSSARLFAEASAAILEMAS